MIKNNPLVILPGWRLESYKYQDLKQKFIEKGYHIFVLDFPGFQKNKLLEKPLTLIDYVEYLNNYLTINKISKPFFICHSFGGRVAIKYSNIYPGKVRALILSGTPGFRTGNHIKFYISFTLSKLAPLFLFWLPKRVKNIIRDWFYIIINNKDYQKADITLRQTFRNIVSESLINYMKNIKIPCLLLWGQNDKLVSPNIAIKMKNTILNAKLIFIPGIGHDLPISEPSIFADKVDNYIQSL